MRFAVLGSGSRGNSALVSSSDTRILIDCGFPLREIIKRLARLGLSPAQLDAILVTPNTPITSMASNCWRGITKSRSISVRVP